jgi:predicted dehydrogenase
MTTRPLRIGVIGANWGLNHIEAWRAVPGVEVAAICTSRQSTAEAAAQRTGVPSAMWDVRRMLDDATLDIIDVTPRPSIRAPLALEVLQSGKHLLQPLPFALDLVQARTLRDEARARSLVAMVENLHRHTPALQQAKAMLEDGALGRIFTIRGHVRTGILLKPPVGYVYGWITDPDSGASTLRNFGAHLLHALTWLFGDIIAVAADISTNLPEIRFSDGSTKFNGTADSATVLTRFRSGATGVMDASWCTTAGEGFLIDAVGERGRLVIRADGLGPQNAQLWTARVGDKELTLQVTDERHRDMRGLNLGDDPEQPRRYPLAAMCAGMAQAVREGTSMHAHPDFDEAFAVMRVVETAYRSAEAGGWVKVPDE